MRVSFLVAAALSVACTASAQTTTLRASYPEGPLWDGERLFYAEMGADRVSVYERGERRTFFEQRGCGPTAIAPYGGGFVILCHLGARVVAVDVDGVETRRWTQNTRDGAPLHNPNDASADDEGGVYFTDPGTFARGARAEGYVMYLNADGWLTPIAGPLHYPNGVHVAGGALYVSEHLGGRLLRYAVDRSLVEGGPEVLVDFSELEAPSRFRSRYAESGPDGLDIGPDRALYVALYGEGRVLRFSLEGALLGETQVEPRYVTNLAFARDGAMAVTGAFDNRRAPYRGEVRMSAALAPPASPPQGAHWRMLTCASACDVEAERVRGWRAEGAQTRRWQPAERNRTLGAAGAAEFESADACLAALRERMPAGQERYIHYVGGEPRYRITTTHYEEHVFVHNNANNARLFFACFQL